MEFAPVKKKSNSFLIFAVIAAVIVLLLIALPNQLTHPMRKQSMEVLGPLIRTVETPLNTVSRMDSKLKTLDQAQAEVAKLSAQVAELQLRNQLLSDKEAENKRLREMLGFQAASQYELLPCRVISREPSSWWDSVQINVGWANNEDLDKKYHGKYSLTADQPVVSPRGVVGKTGNVSRFVTDVILLVNQNCSISATIEGTKDQGIVQGQGNFEEGKPLVKVNYLPKTSLVAVGQFAVTSGLGPYFPAGLRLGTVTEVPPLKNQYPTFGLYREALIEPTADLNQLDELFIVLGPKNETKEQDQGKSASDSDKDKSDSSSNSGSSSNTDANTPTSAPMDPNK
jgi:rod shape-determining protein MreC